MVITTIIMLMIKESYIYVPAEETEAYSSTQTLMQFIADIFAPLHPAAVLKKRHLDSGVTRLNGQTD